ncbi:MAG: dehydrogenase [Lentisphaerae bacterium GWF2_45_14]|nr:MAG: dehydrogenase [Lentisphaerae bacterium GWF2_45_14]
MTKIRCAVVGLGMGSGHVANFQKHPDAVVVAVADPDKARLEERGKKQYGIEKLYTSAEEMFKKEKLDIVAIATPNKFHKDLAIKALQAGINVLCEKPMAINAKEAREMKKVADKVGKRLMINFSYRFTEQSHAIKQEVDSGILGDIYFARTQWLRRRGMPGFGGWFGQKELSGGGPLIDLGVHRLDLALWLMGYPEPEWVMGSTYNHIGASAAAREKKKFDVEDLAVAMIKFKNGATLELEASWAGNVKEREFMSTQLLGTKGGLRQYNINEGYEFEAEFYLEQNGVQYDMKVHPPVPAAKSSIHHFIDCIISGKPHIATAEEGIIVMEILDAIYESAKKGAPLKIKS